jgi:hypothetical protein
MAEYHDYDVTNQKYEFHKIKGKKYHGKPNKIFRK